MTLYMAVTADWYELPLAVETTLGGLAGKVGIKSKTVAYYLAPSKHEMNENRRDFRFRKVEVEG